MNEVTVGSLFSGIGGIDLGLERAGFKILWQVENDKYATKVLEKHWPNVARFRDVRECGKHNLPPVDVLAGGFPCQPHSTAGKRKASEDERNLWPQFYRIIRELKPQWVLAENVLGLLESESGLFFGAILRDLASSGYDAEWRVLSASMCGARHKRNRVFLVAYANGYESATTTQPGIDSTTGTKISPERLYSPFPDTSSIRSQTILKESGLLSEDERTGLFVPTHNYSFIFRRPIRKWEIWANEPGVGRVADGVPRWMDRIKGLGNAVVPQVAEYVGECLMERIRNEETTF